VLGILANTVLSNAIDTECLSYANIINTAKLTVYTDMKGRKIDLEWAQVYGKMKRIWIECGNRWLPYKEAMERAGMRGIQPRTFDRYLQKMVKAKILEKEESGYKKTKYRLRTRRAKAQWGEDLEMRSTLYATFAVLDTYNSLIGQAMNLKVSDKDFLKELADKIGVSVVYSMLLSLSSGNSREAETWLTKGFSSSWFQRCLYLHLLAGRAVGKPTTFRPPRQARKAKLELKLDRGKFYLSPKVGWDEFFGADYLDWLLPKIPKSRVEEMLKSLMSLCPTDVNHLQEIAEPKAQMSKLFDMFGMEQVTKKADTSSP
jgi:hypothetical protein